MQSNYRTYPESSDSDDYSPAFSTSYYRRKPGSSTSAKESSAFSRGSLGLNTTKAKAIAKNEK